MKKLRFSFVIPALNEEEYIGDCIKSIKHQLGKNDEIIVVDNGSVDKTINIAKSLGCGVFTEKRKGQSYARNKGATVANGNHLCFVDADGVVSKSWVKRAKKILKKDKKIKAIIGLNIYMHANLLKMVWYNTYTFVAYFLLGTSNFLLGKSYIACSNTVVRRDVFLKLGGFEPVIAEDLWLSRKFDKLKGKTMYFDAGMVIEYSSRRFDKHGYIRTLFFWIKGAFIKISQDGYDLKNDRY